MDELWYALHQLWPEGSVFRYFARHPEGRVFGCAVYTLAELHRLANWADSNGWNSYWQMNPTRRRTGTKCSSEDITHWCFFPLDLDPDIGGLDPGEVAHAWWGGPGHHWEIDSGRGVQVLLPFPPTTTENASRCMAYWLHKIAKEEVPDPPYDDYKLDTSCSDLPRVMRLPDTVNQKTGRRARLIRQDPPSPGWGDWLRERTPPEIFAERQVEPVGNLTHWTQYRRHLTVAAQRFLREGAPSPGRHHAATATMLSLIEQGASEAQVLEALKHGALLCTPKVLPVKDVEDMVARRFKKVLTTGC